MCHTGEGLIATVCADDENNWIIIKNYQGEKVYQYEKREAFTVVHFRDTILFINGCMLFDFKSGRELFKKEGQSTSLITLPVTINHRNCWRA